MIDSPAPVIPRSVLAIGIDAELRGSLARIAAGRVIAIDYFASRTCSVVIGDLTCDLLPDAPTGEFTELAPLEGVRVFMEPRLVELIGEADATIRYGGPPFARHLSIEIDEPERWIEFLDRPGIVAGKNRYALHLGGRGRWRAGGT